MIDLTWKEIATAAWALWLAALTFAAKYLFSSLSSKASRAELQAVLERVDKHYDEARESRAKLHDKLDKTIEAMHVTAVRVGELRGRASAEGDDDQRVA